MRSSTWCTGRCMARKEPGMGRWGRENRRRPSVTLCPSWPFLGLAQFLGTQRELEARSSPAGSCCCCSAPDDGLYKTKRQTCFNLLLPRPWYQQKDCRENSSDSCISFLLIFKLAELSASRGSGSLGEKTPASRRNPSKINTGLRLLFQVFSSSHTMPQNSSEIIWARKFPSDASPKSCLYEGSQTWSIPGNSQWLTLKPSILIQLLLCKCCPSNFFSKNSCFKYASTSSSSNSSAHVSAFLSSYTALVEIGEENRQHYIKGKWHWCILDYICCKAFGRVVLELSESHYFSPQALLYSGPSFLHASAVKKLQCNYNQQLNEYICVPLPIHKYSDGPHMQVSVKLQLLHGQTRFMHHWCITHASINEVTSPRITLYQNQSDLSTKSALAACVEYLHQPARITGNAFLCKTVKKKACIFYATGMDSIQRRLHPRKYMWCRISLAVWLFQEQ